MSVKATRVFVLITVAFIAALLVGGVSGALSWWWVLAFSSLTTLNVGLAVSRGSR